MMPGAFTYIAKLDDPGFFWPSFSWNGIPDDLAKGKDTTIEKEWTGIWNEIQNNEEYVLIVAKTPDGGWPIRARGVPKKPGGVRRNLIGTVRSDSRQRFDRSPQRV